VNELIVSHATTALFVPGDRPDRFDRARASGADLDIIDLEDAVPRDAKEAARANAVRSLRDSDDSSRTVVRINVLDDGGLDDISALSSLGGSGWLRAVMLPKAETEEQIEAVRSIVGPETAIIALIETVKGLRQVSRIASHPGVVRLGFGALDFSVDVDASGSTLLDHARCEIVLASRDAGISAPFESPIPDFRDLEALGVSARRSRGLGFGGQLCIHPAQVSVVAAAFLPTAEERGWAERIMAATQGGVTQVDGAMVDRPVLLRAQAILARWARAES